MMHLSVNHFDIAAGKCGANFNKCMYCRVALSIIINHHTFVNYILY